MTSEEKQVAEGAKALLESSPLIEQLGQIALWDEQAKLELPCTVVSAKLQTEDSSGALPIEYELKVELRSLSQLNDEAAIDEAFRAIGSALSTVPGTWPAAITGVFNYFRIEEQTGSGSESGDVHVRSRTYRLFAQLIT